TSTTSYGNNASHLYIANNLFEAGHPTSTGGAYYAVSLNGSTSAAYGFDSSYIIDNELRNFYYYGLRLYYGRDNVVKGNDINKITKTSTSTTYGMYIYYGTGNTIDGNRLHDFAPSI